MIAETASAGILVAQPRITNGASGKPLAQLSYLGGPPSFGQRRSSILANRLTNRMTCIGPSLTPKLSNLLKAHRFPYRLQFSADGAATGRSHPRNQCRCGLYATPPATQVLTVEMNIWWHVAHSHLRRPSKVKLNVRNVCRPFRPY